MSEKVYITQYNFSRMIHQLDTSKVVGDNDINNIMEQCIPDNLLSFLNKSERKIIILIKEVLITPEILVNKEYKKIPKDTYTYVQETAPSFHTNPNCNSLHSGFNGTKIPDKIKKMGINKIKEFRLIWKKFHNLHGQLSIYDKQFNKVLNDLFGVSLDEIEIVTKNNSGITEVENESLEQIIGKIKHELEEFYKWISNDEVRKYSMKISYNGKCAFWGTRKDMLNISKANINNMFSNDDIASTLKEIDNYKTTIRNHIIKYYMTKYNPELSFDKDLLTQLGFVECTWCYSQVIKSL